MKSDFIDFIENARKRQGQKFRNQLAVFSICLLISVSLWALVKLSKEYTFTLDYHLQYTNIPDNLTLIKTSDSSLTLRLRVQGYEFLSSRIISYQDDIYTIDIERVKLKQRGTYYTGYILTKNIGYEISSQTAFRNMIINTSPDTIFITLQNR